MRHVSEVSAKFFPQLCGFTTVLLTVRHWQPGSLYLIGNYSVPVVSEDR
jgi:hypothetical protein